MTSIGQKIIGLSFLTLFFLVPLVLCPLNFELFEYNKMMLTYAITIIIYTIWLAKAIWKRTISLTKTPLDLPLCLFLSFQILSTIFSIDPHTSIFGYYSRFHGGLLSTFCYLALYYAIVSWGREIGGQKLSLLLSKTILFSGALVAFYGILQHPNPLFRDPSGQWHGIDYQYWVQDVELRVFSTIGQPNWLAAYLAMLIPLAIFFMLTSKTLITKFLYFFLSSLYYLCLLFTNSRAGAGGFFIGFLLLLLLLWRKRNLLSRPSFFLLLLLIFTFTLLTFISGQFLLKRFREIFAPKIFAVTQIPPGETGRIRKIVWKGALAIFKHYPLFGSGVETFAYSYYQFRPKEHNQTTEWDFLYNKAHNEYLNFLATTGIFGFLSYLFLILSFLFWSIKKLFSSLEPKSFFFLSALLSSYLAYLVQNFSGFSVVPIALFFFLFPAFAFLFTENLPAINLRLPRGRLLPSLLLVFIFLISFFLLKTLGKMWWADTYFAKGQALVQEGLFELSYPYLKKAIKLNPGEPLYFDQLAYNAAVLATARQEETEILHLAQEAVSSLKKALSISPLNVNFWKTGIKVFYQLGSLNDQFYQKAKECAKMAMELSPTEPKIPYNLGLIYLQLGEREKAIDSLQKAIELKPDLRAPRYALALVYHQKATKSGKFRQKAIKELKYILQNIDPGDVEAQEKLREWTADTPLGEK